MTPCSKKTLLHVVSLVEWLQEYAGILEM